MILYLDGVTNASYVPLDSVIITDKNGQDHELTWDEGNFGCIHSGRTAVTCFDFSGRYKGVYIDGEYGNTKLKDITPFTVKDIVFDEIDDGPEHFMFALTNLILSDDKEDFNLIGEKEGEPIYIEGGCMPFIDMWLDGEMFFSNDATFKLKNITVIDTNGDSHVITWDGYTMDNDDSIIRNGVPSMMIYVQLQNIHFDGEDFYPDSIENDLAIYTPFLIKDVEYEYQGERADDVWFCIFKLDLINGIEHYLMESDEPIYSTSWKTPE